MYVGGVLNKDVIAARCKFQSRVTHAFCKQECLDWPPCLSAEWSDHYRFCELGTGRCAGYQPDCPQGSLPTFGDGTSADNCSTWGSFPGSLWSGPICDIKN